MQNKDKQYTKAVFVDSTMEEEIKKETCVDTEVSDKYVLEAIKECNTPQSHTMDNKTNAPTTTINGSDYIVVDMSYEDFVKSKNGKDMEDIQWIVTDIWT